MNQTTTPKQSSGGRGGYRAGSGRKPGSLNRMTKAARELAATSGKLPHEILLDIARGNPIRTMVVDEAGNLVPQYECVTPEQVLDASKSAAPYYAPKISTVELISGVGDDDLDAIIARAAAEAGVSIGAGGEGKAGALAPDEQAPRPAARPRVRLRD